MLDAVWYNESAMAIIKLQAPLAGLRGKYGGMIFSANGSGAYVRQWMLPPDPAVTLQVGLRARLATIRHAWGSLTSGQIAVWDALAAAPPELDYNSLGDQIWLSGSAWHTRINMRRVQCGTAIENDAPANVAVNPPATFGLTVYTYVWPGRTDVVTYTQDDFDGFYAVLQISVVASLAQAGTKTGYRSIWCGAIADDVEQDVTAPLAAAFGWLSVGNRLFGRFYKQSTTGIRSVPISVTADVLEEP